MNRLKILESVSALLEIPDIKEEDVAGGFCCLQILALIVPSDVDLNCYSTQEALECADIGQYTYSYFYLIQIWLQA
jgi:hypothetical protein